jgi:hypothetical protein
MFFVFLVLWIPLAKTASAVDACSWADADETSEQVEQDKKILFRVFLFLGLFFAVVAGFAIR